MPESTTAVSSTAVATPPGGTPQQDREFTVEQRSQFQLVLRRFLDHRLAMASLVVLVLVFVLAFVVGGVWKYDPSQLTPDNSVPPSLDHPFGTDAVGKDQFAQVLRGTRISLQISVAVALMATVIGTLWGAIAGYFGGMVDNIMMRIADLILTLPLLAVAAVLAHKFGGTWYLIALVIGGLSWAYVSRVARSVVLSLREKEFIEAARALGASDTRIIMRHLIPNSLGSIIVNATLLVATAILTETALSYLGFGVTAPDTSLGLLISEAQTALVTRPWLFYFPGLFIILIALTINFIGDGLRDALDPQQREGAPVTPAHAAAEDPLASPEPGRRPIAADEQPVIEVSGLTVGFPSEDGMVEAVRGVSYQLRPGEVLGIVGESGSGKSVTSLAVMGLLPGNARVSGSVKFRGKELIGASEADLNKVRGKSVAMIFQDPMTSLNPVYSVGYQVAEAVRAHKKVSKAAALDRAAELLELVRIPNPRQRLDNFPHELSGGMRQRVVIAIAMANDPDVIIADEPTTALDVTVQAQIMESLQLAQQETGAAMVLITHDLGVIAGQADRVMVMYAGKLVEAGTVEDIFYTPRMPYTFGLLGSLPRLDQVSERLTPIAGAPPSVVNMPPGCPFTPRCPLSVAKCEEIEPTLEPTTGPEHLAACHRSDSLIGKSPGDVFDTVVADTAALAAFVQTTEAQS